MHNYGIISDNSALKHRLCFSKELPWKGSSSDESQHLFVEK